jgi:hypothetical protein
MFDGTSLAPAIFAFYLVVLCNFTPELIGCRLRDTLRNSMVAKHVVGMILMLFLVVLTDPTSANTRIYLNVLYSVGLYGLFFITTRMPYYMVMVVLIMLLTVYMIEHSKDPPPPPPPPPPPAAKPAVEEDKAHKAHEADKAAVSAARKLRQQVLVQQVLSGATVVIGVVGFVFYVFEKRREYGAEFSWTDFVAGTASCRGFTPPRPPFWRGRGGRR